MKKTVLVSDAVMLGGAGVTLLFSLFGFAGSMSAWNTDALAFVSTVPALLALAMVAWMVGEMTGVNLPDEVITFNPAQMKATWGITAFGLMVSWLTVDISKDSFFWLQLLGSAAMAVGAVAALLGKLENPLFTAESVPPPPPPPPPPTDVWTS